MTLQKVAPSGVVWRGSIVLFYCSWIDRGDKRLEW